MGQQLTHKCKSQIRLQNHSAKLFKNDTIVSSLQWFSRSMLAVSTGQVDGICSPKPLDCTSLVKAGICCEEVESKRHLDKLFHEAIKMWRFYKPSSIISQIRNISDTHHFQSSFYKNRVSLLLLRQMERIDCTIVHRDSLVMLQTISLRSSFILM